MRLSDKRRIGKLIFQARTEMGWSQEQLGRAINIGKDSISKFERGVKVCSLEHLEDIADKTHRSLTWFLSGDASGEMPTSVEISVRTLRQIIHEELGPRRGRTQRPPARVEPSRVGDFVPVPLLGEVPAGPAADAAALYEETVYVPSRWVRGGRSQYAAHVPTDSMTPTVCVGDIVVIREQTVADSGQIAVLRFLDHAPEGQLSLKRVYLSSGNYLYRGDNPPNQRKKPLPPGATIAGVVVGLIRDLQ